MLLHERKRHTARHVASACFADGGGYPIQSWMGVPHPVLDGEGGTQSLGWGTPSRLGQGVPHPVLDWGVPPIQTWDGVHPVSRMGYPIQTWTGGTRSSLGWGIPHPVLDQGGTPSSLGPGGVPHPVLDQEGTPHPDLGWGTPCQQNGVQYWDGVPPHPHLDLGWGTPHLDLRWGTLPVWIWDVVPPGMGSPLPRLDLGRGTSPPLPASVDRLKLLPSLILRMRAVTKKNILPNEVKLGAEDDLFFEYSFQCCPVLVKLLRRHVVDIHHYSDAFFLDYTEYPPALRCQPFQTAFVEYDGLQEALLDLLYLLTIA